MIPIETLYKDIKIEKYKSIFILKYENTFIENTTLKYNKHFSVLFSEHDYRYLVFYGGRGGGKSEAIASSIVYKISKSENPLRIICIREIQKSINDSVYNLMVQWIDRLDLSNDFKVVHNKISHVNGSTIIFYGMQNHTANSIKSLAGIDIAWVEEAQSLSDKSLDILIPTVRKEKSHIIFSMNPDKNTDAVYKEFLSTENDRPNIFIKKVNIDENPFVSNTLLEERERAKEIYTASKFNHIWAGDLNDDSESVFKNDWFKVIDESYIKDFEVTRSFIVCDTAYKDGDNTDFNCLSYFLELSNNTIVFYDIDLFRSEYPELKARFCNFYDKWKLKYSFKGAYIEDKGSGISLVQESLGKKIFSIKRSGSAKTSSEIVIKGNDNEKGKLSRANYILPMISTKHLSIINTISNFKEIKEQYENFPNPNVNDDIIDTIIDVFAITNYKLSGLDYFLG